MEWVNITAKTLPEAVDLALDNLGVDESEAEIEVLEEPKQGLFGRSRGTARIRARVKPKATRPKMERNRRRRRSETGRGGEQRSRSRSSGRDAKSDNSGDAVAAENDSTAGAAATERNGSGGEKSGGDRGGRNKKQSQRQEKTVIDEATISEVSTHLEQFLTGLAEAFGESGDVSVVSDEAEGVTGVIGGQNGLLIGPKGRTLDAVQELARVSCQRTAPSSVRIRVDVGGYRELRREALEAFARDVADAVRDDGVERRMEPMSSVDRKIVHDALSGAEGIETRSAGAEPNRRVVVVSAGAEIGDAADGADDADDEAVEAVASS